MCVQRSGKHSEALFDQLRSSNHGGLLMAEESAPTHLVLPIPLPSRQASPDTGRPPWFSTLSPFLHPRNSEFWSRTYSAALSDVKETPSWLCGHLAERNNEVDFCWEHVYAPYGKREEAKKSASSVLDNVQSGSKPYRRWPVAAENSQHDVIEVESRETTTFSLEMHENTPIRCDQESSLTATCTRMKEYPESSDLGGDLDCGIPFGEGRAFDAGAGGWGEEGTSTSVTGKHRREDCSSKPKSRKKMKASKIRSNMIGKPISRQPSGVESISSPVEPTEILLQMAEEDCDTQAEGYDTQAEALCRSSQDLRQGQRVSSCLQLRETCPWRDMSPWKLLNNKT